MSSVNLSVRFSDKLNRDVCVDIQSSDITIHTMYARLKAWKQKSVSKAKNVALVQSVPVLKDLDAVVYKPFLSFCSVPFLPVSETQQV